MTNSGPAMTSIGNRQSKAVTTASSGVGDQPRPSEMGGQSAPSVRGCYSARALPRPGVQSPVQRGTPL